MQEQAQEGDVERLKGIAPTVGLIGTGAMMIFNYKAKRDAGATRMNSALNSFTGIEIVGGVPSYVDWNKLGMMWAPAGVGIGVHKVAVAMDVNRSLPAGWNL